MEALQIIKQDVVTEIAKGKNQRYVVSNVLSNVGQYVSIQQQYKTKDDKWHNGKGFWLPLSVTDEIGTAIKKAVESVEVVE